MSELDRHVEDWGLLFEEGGLPRIAGRIWGVLLVADPPELSTAEIQERLGVAKGSVSTNARLLESAGLVERAPVPGSRRLHYRIRSDAFEALMEQKRDATRRWLALARRGVETAGRAGAPTDRLEALEEFYAFIQEEQEAMARRWEGRRD